MSGLRLLLLEAVDARGSPGRRSGTPLVHDEVESWAAPETRRPRRDGQCDRMGVRCDSTPLVRSPSTDWTGLWHCCQKEERSWSRVPRLSAEVVFFSTFRC